MLALLVRVAGDAGDSTSKGFIASQAKQRGHRVHGGARRADSHKVTHHFETSQIRW